MLFRFKTPEDNRPIIHAGYISEKLKELVNKKWDPNTLTKPKKTKTKISPRPKYPYALEPTVYFIAEKIASAPKEIKIKTFTKLWGKAL